MTDVAGWFCYRKFHGKIYYNKYHVWGDQSSKDTKAFYESGRLMKVPLTQEEWDTLSLDELATKYPLPANLKEEKRAELIVRIEGIPPSEKL